MQVVVRYRSTQDSRYPPTQAAVRGEALLLQWVFQDRDQYCKEKEEEEEKNMCPVPCSECVDSSPGGAAASRTRSTVVSVERAVDLKGAIPGWVADFFDRSWPGKTLRAFRSAAAVVEEGSSSAAASQVVVVVESSLPSVKTMQDW